MIITAKAYSKINLHLGVGPAREDGYHELRTVFQTVDLHDTVEVHIGDREVITQGSVVRSLSAPQARGVPEDETNLAWRAVDKLVDLWRSAAESRALPEVDIVIRKGIPVAGGMAGGSADAAAALRAVDHWLGPFGEETLLEVAAELGSDVPFTLIGGTMLGTGRGENLVPVLSRGTYYWAVALAAEGLSTPEVFAKLDFMRSGEMGMDALPASMDIDDLTRALVTGDPEALADCLCNDLQIPALSLLPDLRHTLTAGLSAGALAGIVSGSGPTCVFLCWNNEHARDVAEELVDTGLAASVRIAAGPVPSPNKGAHIVSVVPSADAD